MDVWVELVSNLGFPIAVAAAMGFFIKYIYDVSREDRMELLQTYHNDVDRLRTSLERNTEILTKLMEKI